jgi:hypothetical protein
VFRYFLEETVMSKRAASQPFKESFGLVTYAVLSGGPVPSGLMLEGAAHLAGTLHRAGYRPRVYDFNNFDTIDFISLYGKANFLEWCVDYLHAEVGRLGMRVLGFTLYTNGFYDCIQIAKRLKAQNPGLVIAAGGPLVGWLEEEIFALTDAFDILVRGEGDIAIVKLAELVYRGGTIAEIPGALYRSGTEIVRNKKLAADIETLPLPIYDEDVYPAYNVKIPVATLRTSVGCTWGRCRYCVQPRLHGRYRERRIDDVLLETTMLKSRHGLTYFRLSDPSPKPSRITEIANGLSSDQRFACFLYPEPDLDLGDASKKLLAVFLGLERSDEADLMAMNKSRDTGAHAKRTGLIVEQAKQLGIATIVANIVPVANDTAASIRSHLDYLLEMNPDFVTITPLIPIPRSPLYRKVLRDGPATGICLDENYIERMTRWTFDPLGPPDAWPRTPFQIKVDGEFTAPLTVAKEQFGAPLRAAGISSVSDDIVLMAHNHYKGLSAAQEEKRHQVLMFQQYIREAIGGSLDKEEQPIETDKEKCVGMKESR